MKCPDCPHYKEETCQLAKEGKLAFMEGDCLLRCIVELLTGIYEEAKLANDDTQEGEWWKGPNDNA